AVLAGAFGALYLSLPVVQMWMPILRVDLLALAFTLAGVYCCLRWPRLPEVAALCFAAALLTKYTFVAAPAACFLYLWLRRERRNAARLAFAVFGFAAAAFAATQWSSGGHFAF